MVWNRSAKTQVCEESEFFFFSEGLSEAHSRKGAASLQDCDMEHFIWVGPLTAVRERYRFSVWGTRGTLDRPLIRPAKPAGQWGCVMTCLWCVITIRVRHTACHLSAFQLFGWNVEAVCTHQSKRSLLSVSDFQYETKACRCSPVKALALHRESDPSGIKESSRCPTLQRVDLSR